MHLEFSVKSFIYVKNKGCPRTDPWPKSEWKSDYAGVPQGLGDSSRNTPRVRFGAIKCNSLIPIPIVSKEKGL